MTIWMTFKVILDTLRFRIGFYLLLIVGHQKDTLDGERRAGRDDKGKHYRLVATDESENNDSDNDSTADKAVPPLWKRLLQRMTGTVCSKLREGSS